MDIEFNSGVPSLTGALVQDLEIPRIDMRGASLEWAYPRLPLSLQRIIDKVPIKGDHSRILLNAYVQCILPGTGSCLPGWHLDGPLCPLDPSLPENIHLVVYGGGETEFFPLPFRMTIDEETSQRDIEPPNYMNYMNYIDAYKLPLQHIGSYGRFHFHRGALVEKQEEMKYRLLIRVMETNLIRPQNRNIGPAFGALSSKEERERAEIHINNSLQSEAE